MIRAVPIQCAVCHEAQGAEVVGLNRVGGLDVCDPCLLGLAPQRVRARGWSLAIRQWERRDSEGNVVGYGTEANLRLPRTMGVHFKCRRKTIGWKLVQLIKPSIKAGDPLFDNHVYVRSKNAGLTRTILADEGVQSILMDMLGEGSWIEFNAASLVTHSMRDEYISEARFSSEMCVLASHLERLTTV